MEKQVNRSGPFKDYIAEGVKAGSMVYLSGQVSLDEEGNLVGEKNMKAQVQRAYENVKSGLQAFNLSMDHIVDETWFVTDMKYTMENIEEIFEIRQKCYGKFPEVAQTLIEVKSLVMPELLIEIKCIAQAD